MTRFRPLRRASLRQATAVIALLGAGWAPTFTAHAQDRAMPHTASPVVVLTKIATPWYAPRFLVVSKFRETIPDYDRLPGLDYKYFSISSDDKFGGLYLWRDRASAQAWFGEAWAAQVLKTRGAPAEVRYFEAPVLLDNVPAGAEAPGANGKAVATIVSIKVPAGVTHEQLVQGFKQSVPLFQKVPGLLRKYFTITDDGHFGGIYLWADRAAADRFHDLAWHERITKAYGTDGEVAYFDTPVILPSRLPRPAEIADRLVAAKAAAP